MVRRRLTAGAGSSSVPLAGGDPGYRPRSAHISLKPGEGQSVLMVLVSVIAGQLPSGARVLLWRRSWMTLSTATTAGAMSDRASTTTHSRR